MSDQPLPTPYSPPAPHVPGPRRNVADLTVAIVLMALGVILFALVAFMSMFLAMMSDGCGSGTCDYTLMTVAWFVALLAPPAIFLTAIIITIVRLARRRLAWWIPLVGAVAALGVWFAAAALMSLSTGH